MAMAGWLTDSFGSRNYHRGHHDTAFFFTVVFGFPIWFSFRGCVHVIDVYALKTSKDQLDRVCRFVQEYFGQSAVDPSNLPFFIHIPLKPFRSLKWMAAYYWALWITGIASLGAIADTTAILHSGRSLRPGEDLFLFITWIAFALFAPGLLIYFIIRKPSRRQAAIRSLVADHLGPFSDPAGWDAVFLVQLAHAYNLEDTLPLTALQQAEQKASLGETRDAVILARLAVGIAESLGDEIIRGRAENLTDECLQRMEKMPV